jgi:hypothetical protein
MSCWLVAGCATPALLQKPYSPQSFIPDLKQLRAAGLIDASQTSRLLRFEEYSKYSGGKVVLEGLTYKQVIQRMNKLEPRLVIDPKREVVPPPPNLNEK